MQTYVLACVGNEPTRGGGDGLCDLSARICEPTPRVDDRAYWLFTAAAFADRDDRLSWSATGRYRCMGGTPARVAATVEPVVTLADLRRLPIPAAVIHVEPGDRRTLVNIPTNLYAGAEPVVLRTRVLGIPVRVRVTPDRFRWRYGDGASLSTGDPGAPYPELRTAHTYDWPGEVRVGLSTDYTGTYSVAGGPWQPIEGTATVPSRGVGLSVFELRNHLVTDLVADPPF